MGGGVLCAAGRWNTKNKYHACMYVCIYVCTHVCMYLYVCASVWLRVCVSMYGAGGRAMLHTPHHHQHGRRRRLFTLRDPRACIGYGTTDGKLREEDARRRGISHAHTPPPGVMPGDQNAAQPRAG